MAKAKKQVGKKQVDKKQDIEEVIRELEEADAEAVESVDPEEFEGLPKKDLFRVDEVATYFNVGESTIRLWIENGFFITEKLGGCVRIPRTSIIKFRLAGRVMGRRMG